MHVIAVPVYNNNKLRCCEYLPIGLAEYEDGKIVELDTMSFEHDYLETTLENFASMVDDLTLEEEEFLCNITKGLQYQILHTDSLRNAGDLITEKNIHL
jgi:hypothetical protein